MTIFVVLLMNRDGNFGKARYLLNRFQPRITQEL